ncbi:hypothetical protein INR49_010390 [Caranx melampygus]|nr:hypothetical protein INR49_010390 [Caranx melampygus]
MLCSENAPSSVHLRPPHLVSDPPAASRSTLDLFLGEARWQSPVSRSEAAAMLMGPGGLTVVLRRLLLLTGRRWMLQLSSVLSLMRLP